MTTSLPDIIAKCQIRFDRGDSSQWRHQDYSDLGEEIFNETKVSISINTLKRIFGKIAVYGQYIPQKATIQALETYGSPIVILQKEEDHVEKNLEGEPSIKQKHRRLYILSAAIILAAVLLIVFAVQREDQKLILKSLGTEGLLPTTAFFEYDVPSTADSLFINFGDKSPLLYLNARKGHVGHPYLFPGVFDVSIQNRNKPLFTTKVYVRSESWIGLGFRRQKELPDTYYEFSAEKNVKDSIFTISNTQLNKKGIDTSGLVYTRLCNFKPLDYKEENFIFEATFRNVIDEKGIYCKSTQFQVSGMKNRIRFKLATPGCSNRISNMISEKTQIGTMVNLSKFTTNLGSWTNVKLINSNKKVTLYVNGKILHTENYNQELGEIKGLFIEFEGIGFVKSCRLSTPEGKRLYEF